MKSVTKHDRSSSRRTLTRNERRVLKLLFRNTVMTQLAIAEATDLTQQSVSRIVSALAEEGCLHVGDRTSPGKRGYPSGAITLRPSFVFSVGVSIMADALSLAVVDFTGARRAERSVRGLSASIAATLDWTAGALAEVCADLKISDYAIVGIGLAISGSFIEDGGFNTPHSIEEWAGIDVAAVFSDRFDMFAIADNDGNAAAFAESILGVGRWAASFAYLYLATGVGGGVILNGELWRGRFGNAGEFAGGLPPGHIFPNLELLRSLIASDGKSFSTVDSMLAAFDPSWPTIDEWIERVRGSLSIIASNAAAILDLDAIVLGGRIPKELAVRLISEIEFFDQRRRATTRPVAKIVPAEASGEVTALGAALMPLERKLFSIE